MKTKILYVLVSTIDDIFAEQTYLSLFSLRKFNKGVSVSLLMDNKTAVSLKDRNFDLLAMVDEPVIIELPDEMTNKYKSRVLKTNMRNYVDGDFLYIDSDTIILSDLSDIDDVESNIAAVYEFNRPFELLNKSTLSEIFNRMEAIISSITEYFNSGVMLVKDNAFTRSFFNSWRNEWEKGAKLNILFDQPSLNILNSQYNNCIHELDGVWNCQHRYSYRFIPKARIFHYLFDKTLGYPLMNKDSFMSLKETGSLSDLLLSCLNDPFRQMCDNNVIITGDDIIVHNSKLYSIIKKIHHQKWLFNSVDSFLNYLNFLIVSIRKRTLAPPR